MGLHLAEPSLTITNSLLLFGTSFLAGGMNAVAGGGSFMTFPALIFTGVSPIAANATNNAAMWVAGLASAGAYRQDLDVDRRLLLLMSGVSLVGGTIGSIALLYTEPNFFRKLIPYLLLAATTLFLLGEPLKHKLQSLSPASAQKNSAWGGLVLLQLGIAIYGGFFGAGIGILMLATLTFSGIKNIHGINALKTLLTALINGVATVPFVLAGVIVWPQALVMSLGGSLGSYVIARLVRQVPPAIVRGFISIVAIGMTTYFFVHG
jgi:uncharacterized protein